MTFGTTLEKRTLGEISELRDGIGSFHVALPVRPAGWSISIGDQLENSSISDEDVVISVKNTGRHELIHNMHMPPYNQTKFSRRKIQNGEVVTVFRGKMRDFWSNLTTLRFYALAGSELSFVLSIELEQVRDLPVPIKLTATHRDSI